MRNQIDEYSFTDFPEGYGEFPYIVLRITYAIYMQIPIHFIPEGEIGDPSVQRGTHITISKSSNQEIVQLFNYKQDAIIQIIKKS